MTTSIFAILLGRHGYGMTPEEETWWCWNCVLYGFVSGFVLCAILT